VQRRLTALVAAGAVIGSLATAGTGLGSLPSAGAAPYVATEPIPVPGGPFDAYRAPDLAAAACASTTSCVGVGSYQDGEGTMIGPGSNVPVYPTAPYVDVMSAGAWSAATIPRPAGAQASVMSGISCADGIAFCVAVGNFDTDYVSDSPTTPFAEVLNGGTWSVATFPHGTTELLAVSCPVVGTCVAVGHSIVATFTGGAWTTQRLSPAAGAYSLDLAAISCVKPTHCVAVGTEQLAPPPPIDSEGAVETLSGGTWTLTTIPQLSGLSGVSCLTVKRCVAAGWAYVGMGQFDTYIETPAVATLSGQSWNATVLPQPNASTNASLNSVACSSSSLCTAGGTVSGAADANPFVETLTSGSWVATTAGTSGQTVDIITCVSTTDCLGLKSGVTGQSIATIAIPTQGYWEVGTDGGIFSFGNAPFYGSVGDVHLVAPIVDMAPTPDHLGYWLVAADGGVFSFGDARFYGSMGGRPLDQPIVGMAPTPDGDGYWLVGADGGVFTFGDARFYGSMGGLPLNRPIVGMAAAPGGTGYWLVASDGGVFNFNTIYYGSMGGTPLVAPVVAMASTPTGSGYWLVASDGGVFGFGNARFYGSMGGRPLNEPIEGFATTSDGLGYRLVARDGGIFSFGDAQFYGSMGGQLLNAPVVGGSTAT
jgi:hypothetical protein